MKIDKEELKQIIGGGNLSGSLVSAFKGIVSVFFDIGQAVGGAFRRITTHNLCSF